MNQSFFFSFSVGIYLDHFTTFQVNHFPGKSAAKNKIRLYKTKKVNPVFCKENTNIKQYGFFWQKVKALITVS